MGDSIFQDIMVNAPNKSVFDLSHSHKTTLKFGYLVPIMIQECLPNDTWKIQVQQMTRFKPLIAPMFQDVEVSQHHFFVPLRLLWDNFENFIRGPRSATDTNIPVMPTLDVSELSGDNVEKSSLANYLGLPVNYLFGTYRNSSIPIQISALPFKAYQKIYFDYYRDQNLFDPLAEWTPLRDGVQTPEETLDILTLRKRAWQHDYFTSALPFAQKGEPVPIPVIGSGNVIFHPDQDAQQKLVDSQGALTPLRGTALGVQSVTSDLGAGNSFNGDVNIDPNGTLKAIIDNVTTTIKDLRTAEALQSFLEKNARAGNRYFEYLRAVFNQQSPDARLHRAEYIGGSKYQMNISEVLQTSATQEDSPLGDQAGHAVAVNSSDNSTYHCQEHGFIITLLNVRPRTSYMQGVHRMFHRMDRFDFALPDFAKIGEQEVKNYEIFAFGNEEGTTTPTFEEYNGTFGYLPRYAEYKHCIDRISGEFADKSEVGLFYWHLGRYFKNRPVLNGQFIECDPDTRIFPVTDPDLLGDYILTDTYFDLSVSRVLPRFDIPSLV